MNLGQFQSDVAAELGLDGPDNNGTETSRITTVVNKAVQRVLEDTHCYVKETDYTGWDGTSMNYTLDSAILDIVEVQLVSTGITYPLERLSIVDILERRRTGITSGGPTRYFAMSGANLLMFYPPPGSGDTLTAYYIPIPTAMANASDDPSSTSFGGIPEILHEAIFLYACSRMGSYDDDASSAQGQRYRDWYTQEITRYQKIMRQRGGTRNPRAVVNDKRRRRVQHDNSVYPSSY